MIRVLTGDEREIWEVSLVTEEDFETTEGETEDLYKSMESDAQKASSRRTCQPRPSAPSHPRQSKYMWTLKWMSRIRLQDLSRTCDEHSTRTYALQKPHLKP